MLHGQRIIPLRQVWCSMSIVGRLPKTRWGVRVTGVSRLSAKHMQSLSGRGETERGRLRNGATYEAWWRRWRCGGGSGDGGGCGVVVVPVDRCNMFVRQIRLYMIVVWRFGKIRLARHIGVFVSPNFRDYLSSTSTQCQPEQEE